MTLTKVFILAPQNNIEMQIIIVLYFYLNQKRFYMAIIFVVKHVLLCKLKMLW